ncbi:hypothetical protein GCK32_018410 [Trichostrongylus colubriformis]|uniref:Peptidase M13 C-terminal domain-containing protein n=1 Tax=Trichostrongylus colubriformis TaxID=6319 RepID=A0AAN8IFT4_TRICO
MAKNNDMFVIPQAYKKYAAKLKDSEKSESVDGFTQDQLFFLGFSQMWCRKTGEFAIYERLSDVHPPPEIRVDMERPKWNSEKDELLKNQYRQLLQQKNEPRAAGK